MRNESPKGTIILVIGIISIIGLFPLGLYSWLKGKKELDLYPNDRLLKVGYILGFISSCITIFFGGITILRTTIVFILKLL